MDEQRLILVVEDDDVTRAFLLDNLAADGFRVAGASGPGEALRAIEVRQPALVVLDLALEDGRGLTLLAGDRPERPLRGHGSRAELRRRRRRSSVQAVAFCFGGVEPCS